MFSFLSYKKRPVNTDPQKIQEILTRGVEDVFVKESLQKKLESGKRLRIKLGFDPTGDKIHIGRAIPLRKLKAFQDLGHQVVFVVGDFTAQIGDPSDKLEKRPMLTKKDVEKNLQTYKEQVGSIINLSEAEFYFNSRGLSSLNLEEVIQLAETFSVQQMLSRRNFKERFEKGKDISLREFMYPLMQGYDSVSLKADIEIGGFDQLFNLKAGRIIQKQYGQPEQDVLTTQMLEGTDGRKMSTSWGNVINITDNPNDMYGKVMSVKDELLPQYFLLCTDVPQSEIATILEKNHPKEAKMKLAKEIVSIYHGPTEAEQAEKMFTQTFSEGKIPNDVPVFRVTKGDTLIDALVTHAILSSKSEAKRFMQEGGIKDVTTDNSIKEFGYALEHTQTFRVGKKKFVTFEI